MYPLIHSHPNQTNLRCSFSRLTPPISVAGDTKPSSLLIRALQDQEGEIARRHILVINRDRPWRGLPLPVRATLRTTANHQLHLNFSTSEKNLLRAPLRLGGIRLNDDIVPYHVAEIPGP